MSCKLLVWSQFPGSTFGVGMYWLKKAWNWKAAYRCAKTQGKEFLSTSRPDSSSVEICFFHLVRLFWNHVLTWASLNFRLLAKLFLSLMDKYFFLVNLCSSDFSCPLVNAVRRRRFLRMRQASLCEENAFKSSLQFSSSSLVNRFSLTSPDEYTGNNDHLVT